MSKLVEDTITYTVSYLEMMFGDEVLANGSAFFWRRNARPYLVTNWHNLSGRRPEDKKPKHSKCAIPDRVRFTYWSQSAIPDQPGLVHLTPTKVVAHLADPKTGIARWFEHAVHREKVDVAILDLGLGGVAEIPLSFANESDFDGKVRPYVSQDIFIVGYPLGVVGDVPLPIWKRGTIATEPHMHYDGVPKVYVDTASRIGMSGSLVLARFDGFGPYEKLDGSKSDSLIWRARKIFGVYSGRLHPDEVQIQLGIVWRSELIDEIIEGGKKYEG